MLDVYAPSALTAWAEAHEGSLDAKVVRGASSGVDAAPPARGDPAPATVDVTLVRVPAAADCDKPRENWGLGKVRPPGVGWVFFKRGGGNLGAKECLLELGSATMVRMFKKVRPKMTENEVSVRGHPTLGDIQVPVVPDVVWRARLERRELSADAGKWWRAMGSKRHGTPMKSHSQRPDRVGMKKLMPRNTRKAWSQFKQSSMCRAHVGGGSLAETALFQVFVQTITRIEREKWSDRKGEKTERQVATVALGKRKEPVADEVSLNKRAKKEESSSGSSSSSSDSSSESDSD
eukprot:g1015.t1